MISETRTCDSPFIDEYIIFRASEKTEIICPVDFETSGAAHGGDLALFDVNRKHGGEDAPGGFSEGLGAVAAMGLVVDFFVFPLLVGIFL